MTDEQAVRKMKPRFPTQEFARFETEEVRRVARQFVRNSLNWQWSRGTHSMDQSPPLLHIEEGVWFDRYMPDLKDIPPRAFTRIGTDSVESDRDEPPQTLWIDYTGREVAPPKVRRELPHDRPWGPGFELEAESPSCRRGSSRNG